MAESRNTPSRAELVALDRRHLWRPYTSREEHEGLDPLVIVSAEGPWLTDANGKRYLDGTASWWTCNLGHRHPRLVRALSEQSAELMHCAMAGMAHPQAVLLAEELLETAPKGLARVFFSDNGSTSVEVALKMALQYWHQNGQPERTRFISLGGGYHGDTLGAMSIGGIAEFKATFGPLLFESIQPKDVSRGGDWEQAISEIETLLRVRSREIAAVVVEPMVQGAAGMRMWPAALLSRLRQATERADTFLIADEVFTGLGRTGEMWACDHAKVTPDILCTAKGLSGGALPFAATLATERVFDGFRGGADRALMHGHTFYGNALGAALAREVLAIYRQEQILEQVRAKAPVLKARFGELGRLPGVERARALGMIAAIDLGKTGYHEPLGRRVAAAALRRGAYLRPLGNTVFLVPPLNISEPDLGTLLDILCESVEEVLES